MHGLILGMSGIQATSYASPGRQSGDALTEQALGRPATPLGDATF